MKKISIIGLLSMSLVAGLTTTSCEDMMTIDTDLNNYTSANDTLYSYWGILKCVQDVAERQVILGELRGDLVSTTENVTDTLIAIANFNNPKDGSCSMLKVSDYYNVINNCNLYIANADTSLVKSNKKYMIPEYAQVQSIRAWTYLQLVKNYGEVPFITEPINSLDVIDNFDYHNNLVNKDNLLDKFLDLGLDKFVDTEYPHYQSYNSGSSVEAALCYIPVRLVLGDMYLLRGASKEDYRAAAQYYYDYLKNNTGNVTRQYVQWKTSRVTASGYTSEGQGQWGSWGSVYSTANRATTNDVITSIPSASNQQYGTMLMRVADIYGFTPSSSQTTNVSENDEGNEEVTSSGAISVALNLKPQTTPSPAYTTLNRVQNYVFYDLSTSTPRRTDYPVGDARYEYSVFETTYEGDPYVYCAKASRLGQFYYTIPIYRKSLIWLRLAEAINRAGFPQYAFGILKDGLCEDNMPQMDTRREIKLRMTEEGDTVFTEDGSTINDTIYVRYVRTNSRGALYYVDSLEVQNFFLPFTETVWQNNFGIHARGCGYGTWNSVDYITTNLTGFNDSTNYTYDRMLAEQGVDVTTASEAEIINAVENVIVDELALETAFEGNRFTDLVRIAEHKNASGFKGTDWLAGKVADRELYYNPLTLESSGERNSELYNKLLDPSNWYFTLPAWRTNK